MEWQPIETAPKDGKRILVCNRKWSGIARWGRDFYEEGFICDGGWLINGTLTNWMPLPEPPK